MVATNSPGIVAVRDCAAQGIIKTAHSANGVFAFDITFRNPNVLDGSFIMSEQPLIFVFGVDVNAAYGMSLPVKGVAEFITAISYGSPCVIRSRVFPILPVGSVVQHDVGGEQDGLAAEIISVVYQFRQAC